MTTRAELREAHRVHEDRPRHDIRWCDCATAKAYRNNFCARCGERPPFGGDYRDRHGDRICGYCYLKPA